VRSVVVLAVFVAAPFFVIGVSAASSAQPPQYRFTGWVTASPALAADPAHLVIEGDAPQLRFTDRSNLSRHRTAYRGCVSKLLSSSSRCLTATAPIDGKPSALALPARCCGDFIARWYVGGRLVAAWRFRYVPEHA
jgi:hypothetical protein